jgi:DNA-binding NarL/FixJ family response regulator
VLGEEDAVATPYRFGRPAARLWGVTRVLIVDDHPAVRAGLRSLVHGEPGFSVVGVEADAESALATTERVMPDVVLLDVHLPGEDGLSVCLRLDGAADRPRLVLYSAFADERLAVLAAVAGADAVVSKSADPQQLLDVLARVASGHATLPAPDPATLQVVGAALDEEDLPVLGMLLHGTPPAALAQTLGMSEAWLHARRWAILQRLGARRGRRNVTAAPDLAGSRSG